MSYPHFRNAAIRMEHARGCASDGINDAIDRAEEEQRRSNWRDAADAFYTAAFLSEDDPEIMALLICKGDACLVRAELSEPGPLFEPFLGDGI